MRDVIKSFTVATLILLCCFGANARVDSRQKRNVTLYTGPLFYQTHGDGGDPVFEFVLWRYGIKTTRVAGCIVSDSIIQAAERNNKLLFEELSTSLGTDAHSKLLAESREVARVQERVEELLNRDSEIQKKQGTVLNGEIVNGVPLHFGYAISVGVDKFIVPIDVIKPWKGKWKYLHWRDYLVDISTGSVVQIQK
jgi:hypothetical protein